MSTTVDVTRLLDAAAREEPGAADALARATYTELRRMAAAQLSGERTRMSATALVHEAWLKLHHGGAPFDSRAHFFGSAARAMRRLLVDRARARARLKRGGEAERVALRDDVLTSSRPSEQVLAVHEALGGLAAEHPDAARLVELRWFGGLSMKECAETLDVSRPTVQRWWAFARAWLFDALGG